MSNAVPIIRQDGEGELMWFAGGGAFTWKATAQETGGAFIAMEDKMERGKVTPNHSHPRHDEAIWVLEGTLLVDVEGAQQEVAEGGFFFAPRGVPHAFMVVSDHARVISWQTPGSGESFYRAAGRTANSEEEAAQPADFALLRDVAEASDCIELHGPPPFDVEAIAAARAQ